MLHRPADAFALAQKTKARSLLDLMRAGKVDFTQSLTLEERRQEQQKQERLSQCSKNLVAFVTGNIEAPASHIDDLHQQIEQAQTDLQTFEESLYSRHPELADKRAAKTVMLTQTASFLPANAALLEYVTFQKEEGANLLDQTLLFCVTVRAGKPVLSVHRILLPSTTLTERVNAFRIACALPDGDYKAKAQYLYKLLIAPAAKQLAGKNRLIVCPDGPLWGMPFQALLAHATTGSEGFLAQQFEIDYAYSATAVQAALKAKHNPGRRKPTGDLLAMANPDFGDSARFSIAESNPAQQPIATGTRSVDIGSREIILRGEGGILRKGGIIPLPGTQREADGIQQAFPNATVYTGKAAQEATLKQQAGKYRYLHFATHGLFNDAAPMMSSIVLAQPTDDKEDGFLTAREIFDMNLSADMVVLSACNTAQGEKRAGEGVVGLTWALFVAGAPTQVVSQWSVSDASTAQLMQAFYQNLKAGQAKGAALRQAELRLMQDGKHQHPFYWAPFVLVGDWGK